MFKYYYFINLILLAILHDVFTQKDYDYSDYRYEHFLRHRTEKTDRFKVKPFIGLPNIPEIVKNIKTKATEKIVSLGKCLTLCVLGWHKTCWKEISCIWQCLIPNIPFPGKRSRSRQESDSDIFVETVPKTLKRNGTDVKAESRDSDFLTPAEIVGVIKCDIKCLTRHLPHDVMSFAKFLVCSLTRCLCS